MLSTIVWNLLFFGLLGLFGWQIYNRFSVFAKVRPSDRSDNIPERIRLTLVFALGQLKFFRSPKKDFVAGMAHVIVFWGFLVLGYQVTTMFARGWFPHFEIPLMGAQMLGGPVMALRDLFEVLVAGAALFMISRWVFTHPQRLMGFKPAEEKLSNHPHWEAVLILCFIFTITMTGLFYDAGRMIYLAGDPEIEAEKAWAWAGYIASGFLAPLGASGAETVSNAAWWTHNAVVLVFLNFLPLAKHFHVITSIPNVFFSKTQPFGQLSLQDLESEDAIYGVSQMRQFDWKQVLDMYSCTECGRCSSQCPATATNKPLAPRQMLLNLRDFLYENPQSVFDDEFDGKVATGPMGTDVKEVVSDEVLWACTTCRACEDACPVNIEYVDKIIDMRRHLVQEEARFPAELTKAFQGMERQGNPWGINADKRGDWAQGLNIPTIAENPEAEYLFFVGCAGSFDDRAQKITQALAKVLNHAGVSYAILGRDEPCNGDTARRLGNEYLYQSMATMAVEVFAGAEVKKVITNCPHCFNTIKNEFPQFGGEYEVLHAAELVADLIKEGKIKPDTGAVGSVVFHDSCYLGRYNEVYDAPREILKAIGGVDLKEIERSRNTGMCCGAGGGRMWIEEEPDQRVNVLRVEQLLEAKASTIASACPYCMTMLTDGVKDKGQEEQVANKDVMEILADSLPQA
ncbi:MAG: Fe-S oxidoreductase [Hyphomicrobiaceae bacterium]|jgi:Fe-S oxidoreductase